MTVGDAWGEYYRPGMSSDQAQAFKAGYAASEKENQARELHHFEAEQALANIKQYVENNYRAHDPVYADDILSMIPKDI